MKSQKPKDRKNCRIVIVRKSLLKGDVFADNYEALSS